MFGSMFDDEGWGAPQGGLLGRLRGLNNPQRMGLLGAAASVLQASAPSTAPKSFGGSLGAGLMGGLQGLQQGQRFDLLEAEKGLKQAEAGRLAMAQQRQNLLSSLLSGQAPQAQLPRPVATEQSPSGPVAMSPVDPAQTHVETGDINKPRPSQHDVMRHRAQTLINSGFLAEGHEMLKAANEIQKRPQDEVSQLGEILDSAGITDPNVRAKVYADWAKKKTTHAPSTQVNVNAFEPASVQAQKKYIDEVSDRKKQLSTAEVTIQNIEKAKALIPQARGFMGPGGETLLDAAKFMNNRLGTQINTEGVKSAEELRSRIFMQIMDNLKKMDAQPSQQQQQVMQDALGKLGTDPDALPAVLDAFAEVIEGKVADYNKDVKGALERGVMFPYDPEIKLTPRKKTPTTGGRVRTYNPTTGKIE
jgi:hypothetical protein